MNSPTFFHVMLVETADLSIRSQFDQPDLRVGLPERRIGLIVWAMPRRNFFTVVVTMLACTPLLAVGSDGTPFGLPAWVVLALFGCVIFPAVIVVMMERHWEVMANPDEDEEKRES